MVVRYQPAKLLRKMAPEELIERLVTQKLTLNKTVLGLLDRLDIMDSKTLKTTALKVIKEYQKNYKAEKRSGATNAEAREEAVGENRLLVNRVNNTILQSISQRIVDNYRGEYYTWLKSTAKVPDEEHRQNWGKRFQLGKGEAPGERLGCQCGMRIEVTSRTLDLEE